MDDTETSTQNEAKGGRGRGKGNGEGGRIQKGQKIKPEKNKKAAIGR